MRIKIVFSLLFLTGGELIFGLKQSAMLKSNECSISHKNMKLLNSKTSNDQSTRNSFLKTVSDPLVSLGAGSAGLMVLLFNRLGSLGLDSVSDVQSRTDILSVIACSSLLLSVLSDQDITTKDREAVALVGYALQRARLAETLTLPESAVQWCVDALLEGSPANSVLLLEQTANAGGDWTVVAAGGVVGGGIGPSGPLPSVPRLSAKILTQALQTGEVYLPDLQILPGKIEFSYLPVNCQSVLVLPVKPSGGETESAGDRGAVLVVGTNQAKALKFRDLTKIRNLLQVFQTLI